MDDYQKTINDYISDEINVINSLDVRDIADVVSVLEDARVNGKRVFTCGNGGSAATASHFVCDLEKGASENKTPRFDAECLSDNTPTMMAISNDLSYEDALAQRLINKGHEGDVLICISGSGNSENIVRAATIAKRMKMIVIGLVGYDGGKIKEMSDYCVHANIENMQISEDIHMILDHIIMWTLCH